MQKIDTFQAQGLSTYAHRLDCTSRCGLWSGHPAFSSLVLVQEVSDMDCDAEHFPLRQISGGLSDMASNSQPGTHAKRRPQIGLRHPLY